LGSFGTLCTGALAYNVLEGSEKYAKGDKLAGGLQIGGALFGLGVQYGGPIVNAFRGGPVPNELVIGVNNAEVLGRNGTLILKQNPATGEYYQVLGLPGPSYVVPGSLSDGAVIARTTADAGSKLTTSVGNQSTPLLGPVTSQGMANAATAGKLYQQLWDEQVAAAGINKSSLVVLADGKIEGRVYIDTNQTARPAVSANASEYTTVPADRVAARAAQWGIVNGDMATAHAEIGVIQQAVREGVAKGADLTMTVTGEPICSFCRGDIPLAAKAAGLNSLTIVEAATGRTFYWRNDPEKAMPMPLKVKKP
jgi:hypothetical protein